MIFLSAILNSLATEYSTLYSISDMNDLSSRVVQGEIIEKDSYYKNGKIYSTLLVQVDKTYTGINESELEIEVLGGEVDGITMSVSGLPNLEIGQQSLLFLNHDKLLGLGQGVFHIQDSEAIRPRKTGLPASKIDLSLMPDEQEAASCLAPMIDTHYTQGWNLKHMYAHHSSSEVSNIFPIGTYEGLSYKILTCSDGKPKELALTLSDQQGNPKQQDIFTEQSGSLTFIAEESSVLRLGVHVQNLKHQSVSSGFAVAILYRE